MKCIHLLKWLTCVTGMIATATTSNQVSNLDTTCPPWLDHDNGTCYCKKLTYFRVKCDRNNDVQVAVGDCVTWDERENATVITNCPYTPKNLSIVCKDLRYTVPANVSASNLTSFVCSQFNRMGTHCGECMPGYGPAPFLNGANIPCAKCHHHNYLWLLILFLQLFVIAALYFTFVFCECRGVSSPLSVMAYFYQIVTNGITTNVEAYASLTCDMNSYAMQVIFNMCAFWNLDFLNFSLPALCVSPSLTNAQVLLFDYLIAFFPVLLTLLSYLLISLHDKGAWLVVRIWKPFHVFISRYKKHWNPKQSILNTFATFLVLSYSKLLFTSVNLLYGVTVYDNNGRIVQNSPLLYYDSTVKYFGLKHLPYVCLSLLVLIVFIVLPPTILILYPTRCFKQLLERCGFKRWHTLSIIMDVFQGWYKDGTNSKHDFRALSALYMVLRIAFAVEFILVILLQYRSEFTSTKWTVPALVHLALGCFYFVAKPYKKVWMNSVDGLVLIFLGAVIFLMIRRDSAVLSGFILCVPLIVLGVYVLYGCAKQVFMAFKSAPDAASSRSLFYQRELRSHTPLQPSVSFQEKLSNDSSNSCSYGGVN